MSAIAEGPAVLDPDAERWVARSTRRSRRRAFMDRGFLLTCGASIFVVVILASILVPIFWPADAYEQNLLGRLKGPGSRSDTLHLFGTDALGRDVFARVFLGGRYSLSIAFVAVLGALIVGTVVGLLAGYHRGWVDAVLMRFTDLQLAFPLVLLALALIGLLGPSGLNVVIVFTLTGWPVFARTVRASTLTLRERAFVDAARTMGAGTTRIMLRHVLPNAMGSLVVVATFELAKVLIYESSLSFLGLGVQPPAPTWGNVMADGRSYLQTAWWITFFPGITLVLTAAAANWLGDGLNQLLDPRSRRR